MSDQMFRWTHKGLRYRWHAWWGHYLYRTYSRYSLPWCAIQRWHCADCQIDFD